jgi:hypothetical protein
LEIPEHAYFFGFISGDGHLCQGVGRKGNLSIEIAARDRPLLERFADLFPVNSRLSERTRDTNFKRAHTSCCLTICAVEFREKLIELGLPHSKKSETVGIPNANFSEIDFYRGLIDADGSLGMSKEGRPFLTLTTSSDSIASHYKEFLQGITGKPSNTNRNKRDNVFNIMVWRNDAKTAAERLYYNGCLALPRKRLMAQTIKEWVKPKREPQGSYPKWTAQEDSILSSNSLLDCQQMMSHRTPAAVRLRHYKLRRAAYKDIKDPYKD